MEGKLNEEQVKLVLEPWRLSMSATGLEGRLVAALELYERFPLDVAVTGGTREANARLATEICGRKEGQGEEDEWEEEEEEEEEDDDEEDEEEEDEEVETEGDRDGTSIKERKNSGKRVRIKGYEDNEKEEKKGDTNVSGNPNCLPILVHPHIPNIRIWNVESCAAPYSISRRSSGNQQHTLAHYDVLVVLTSELLQEDHRRLTMEPCERDQPLYLVRAEQEWDVVQEKLVGPCKTCAWERMRDRNLEIQRRRKSAGMGAKGSKDSQRSSDLSLDGKLVEFGEIGEVLMTALPELRKRAFCHFMVDVTRELRVPKLLRNDKMSMISTALKVGKMTKEDIDQISELFQSRDLTNHPSRLLSALGALEHFRLDVGILGPSGCGSSSLLNSLLGRDNGDETAAPTGVTETTEEAVAYPHSELPNVLLWDLPGTGRVGGLMSHSPEGSQGAAPPLPPLHPPCDVYILVSPLRLSLDIVRLLQHVSALGKGCYLVLSQADQIKEGSIGEVRRWSEEVLGRLGFNQTIFLVSALHPEGMDFPKLREALRCAIPTHKRIAFANYVAKLLEQDVFWKRVDPCKVM